jgi:rhodanese-related sulfurtransferase
VNMMKKSAFVFVAALILSVFISAETSNVAILAGKRPVLESIGVDEAVEFIEKNKDNGDFIILDIRTPEEYESGHLENAINIDFYSDSFQQELARLDKKKTYLEYCRSGGRSARALDLMKDLGFTEVYNMKGGITSWRENGYPVE